MFKPTSDLRKIARTRWRQDLDYMARARARGDHMAYGQDVIEVELQQRWYDEETMKEEWRDIPTVVEKKDA